jgi:GTP cyclohydrolase II
VEEQVPTGVHLSSANWRYLAAKAGHGSHDLDLDLDTRRSG